MLRSLTRPLVVAALLAGPLSLGLATLAEARAGRGGSIGSRGARTEAPAPPTATAPRTNPGFDRTITQTRPQAAPATAGRVGAPQQRFGGGLMGAFAMGLIGAGIFGLLAGTGFFAGGLAGFLGMLLQLALIGLLVYAVVRLVRGRRAEQPAVASGPAFERQMANVTGAGGYGAGGLGVAAAARMPQAPSDAVGIGPQDYADFERLLGEVQTAYGRGDVGALRLRVSPEMASYFEGELADLRDRGLSPAISGVRLLQGDLAEAWREGELDYATVAMRYAIVDQVFDRSGVPVEGSAQPQEVTELWTFVRGPMTQARWFLSAIQQTG
jgi:predicted lipid-binding transport protein (Tim44 family)